MFDAILHPFAWAISYVWVWIHDLLVLLGMSSGSGIAWVLSIVLLTVLVRIAIIPLFLKQIRSSRAMQAIQPEMRKIQEKYKGKKDQLSRQAMAQEQMEMYRKHGTNPFASCLPILAQMPIFFGLYQVLMGVPTAAQSNESVLMLPADLVHQFNDSQIFGAQLFATMLHPGAGDTTATVVQAVIMIVLMSATQFYIQKQLSVKNMSEAALNSPMFRQQQMIMYIFPIIFAVSGINFPLGVMYYWTVSNLWSLGQQWWVIRNNPTPGSQAERELNARRAAKGLPPIGKTREQHEKELQEARERAAAGQRQQPVGKKRQKQQRNKQNGKK